MHSERVALSYELLKCVVIRDEALTGYSTPVNSKASPHAIVSTGTGTEKVLNPVSIVM